MENKEKKEYGGCLSVLLPLWIIGQILTIIYNLAFAGLYIEFTMIPIILIGTNIIALVGIILLLQFKRIGFYIFILTFVITFFVGVLFPDYVKDHTILRSIFGLGLFLLLMSFKNKKTKLNGYQTLGFLKYQDNSEDYASQEQTTIDNEVANANNEIIVSDNNNEEEVTISENDNLEVISEIIKEDNQAQGVNNNRIDLISESPRKTKKFVYLITSLLLIIIIIVALVLITNDNRSDQEIYNDAKVLIDKKKYKEGVEELHKIGDDYPQAKSLLGKLYYYNDTIGINKELGEKLLWEAYEKKDSNACVTLFDIYIEKGDWDILYQLSTRLTEIGCYRGYRGLAWLYWTDDIGGEKNSKIDYKKAEYYALKIAKNDSYSSFYLGQIYSDGGHGVEKDYNKAFYWWKNGAKLGDASCYDNLGWSYFYGIGVNQNHQKAYESYRNAIKIDSTDAYAYHYIAIMFKNGLYVKANIDSLKYYLQKAKDYGNEDALIMYENEF